MGAMTRILTTTVASGLASVCSVLAVLAVAPMGLVAAHTESDLVAVPAGAEATVTLKPTHGCGGSPTVAVRIRAPFPDAVAEDVEGWSASATPDGSGNTVLEWTGGVLPADEDGAFPVEFVAPDAPGTLLTFPAVQVCADGAELAWISGDPADEFPAPRVLVLPAGSTAAATIDDVPLDAPGREQLVAIADVDNPQATPATSPPATTVPTVPTVPTTVTPVTTTAPATTAAPVTTASVVGTVPGTTPTTATTTPTTEAGGGGSSNAAAKVVTGLVLVAAVVMAGAAVLVRRRDRRRARDA
jgi:uncharacterized protein YcnI